MAGGVVLVEGKTDVIALEALAERRGRDLEAEGVVLVPIGGAQAIGRHLRELAGSGVRLAGLCDAGEERHFARALERAGLGARLDRAGMERIGFFVCVENLEDELIRALGASGVEEVVDAEGDLETFRSFQNQPAWRGRSTEAQLRRWMHNGDRHLRYPPLLLRALELDRIPPPLDGVLAHV
jgi:Overcoming lysogenization defect protein-like, TOPRIM domain